MRLDERARDREAEAAPLDSLRSRLAAHELAEDLTLEVRGDADALVLDADADDVVVSLAGDAHDAAARRILDRVREQVRDHLGEAIGVAAHGQRRRRQRDVEQVLRALAREELRLFAHDGTDVDQLFRDRELALLEPLDVEEVVDEGAEAAGLRLDDVEVLAPLLVRHLPLEKHRGEPEHARERRP